MYEIAKQSFFQGICTAPPFSVTFIIRIRYKCNFTPQCGTNERPVRGLTLKRVTLYFVTDRRGHQRCSRPRLLGVEARKFDHEGAR